MTEEVEAHILERYELIQRLGKGAYGVVWKAMDKKYKQVVALKKVFDAFRNSTDAQRTYREVIFLQDLNGHDNVIRLRNIVRAENNMDLYLVFEYMEADLHLVIRANILEDVHRQYIIYQTLKALKYIHSAELIHRDLKPANILINSDVVIKVGDFGLARSVAFQGDDNDYKLSEYVATRWYRAPEILLGSSKYTKAVDMWSVGCILGELLVGKPIFQGKSSLNQIEKVLELVGKPKSEDVEAIDSPHAETILNSLSGIKKKSFHQFFGEITDDAMDLLKKLLTFNPENRITVEEALKHPYVIQFSNPEEEILADHAIEVPLNDFIKLSTKEYRDAIYSHIAKKKRERRRKIQEKYMIQVGMMSDGNEKNQPQQVQYTHSPSLQVTSQVSSPLHKTDKYPPVLTQSSTTLVKSQSSGVSHNHSPVNSKSQGHSLVSMASGVKVKPYRAYERSLSQSKGSFSYMSSSLVMNDEKEKSHSPSPMEKKNFHQGKVRTMIVGKTEIEVPESKDSSPLMKTSSISPQRATANRKTYYVGGSHGGTPIAAGSHVTVKNLLRNSSVNSNKVMSQTGNSFIVKKK